MKSWLKVVTFIVSVSIFNLSCSSASRVTVSEFISRDVKGSFTIVLKDGNELEINKKDYSDVYNKGDYLFIQKEKLDSVNVNMIDSITEERFSFGKTFFLSLGIIIIILFVSSGVMFTKFT